MASISRLTRRASASESSSNSRAIMVGMVGTEIPFGEGFGFEISELCADSVHCDELHVGEYGGFLHHGQPVGGEAPRRGAPVRRGFRRCHLCSCTIRYMNRPLLGRPFGESSGRRVTPSIRAWAEAMLARSAVPVVGQITARAGTPPHAAPRGGMGPTATSMTRRSQLLLERRSVFADRSTSKVLVR